MRRFAHLGTFFAILAAVFCLWHWRFERTPEFPTYRLADLCSIASDAPGVEWLGEGSNPVIRLRVKQPDSPIVACLPFPEIPPISFLHVRYQLAARQLSPGREDWEDGRSIIEWHAKSGVPIVEIDPFGSVRHDQIGVVSECVLGPDKSAAIPVLRIEHLGICGDLELRQFEATVIQERAIWKIGRWALMMAWVAWVAFSIGPVGKHRLVRPLLAGMVSLAMMLYFVIPGPWKILRGLGIPFGIGSGWENTQFMAKPPELSTADLSRTLPQAVKLQSVGKIPDQGDFSLRVKHYAKEARPLLHSLLLFGPTLVISCLVGWKRTVPLMALSSVAIEAAQYFFGYGFDQLDIFDLFNDAAGIALAVLLYRSIRKMKIQSLSLLMDFGVE